jgi:hypothetical protein
MNKVLEKIMKDKGMSMAEIFKMIEDRIKGEVEDMME